MWLIFGSTMDLVTAALTAYDWECKKRNRPCHIEIPSHTCTSRCSFMEFNDKQLGKAFVCRFSKKVHVCGHRCSTYEENNEGIVCYLTGHVLPYNIEAHYTKKQKGCENKYIINTPIRMGKSGAKKKTRLPKFNTDAARSFLKDIFFGPLRIKRYTTHIKSIHTLSTKMGKEASKSGAINFMQFQRAVFKEIDHLLGDNPEPPRPLPDILIERLLISIQTYWNKQPQIQRYKTTNGTLVFVAVCVSKLKSGFTIKNTTVFPKVPWIAKYAPSDAFYTHISEFRCRQLSLMWRKLLENIVDSKSSLPKREGIFVLK